MKSKVAVLGAGSWGTALSCLLARKGLAVTLWGRSPERVRQLGATRENRRYLPGVFLPSDVEVTGDLKEATAIAEVVVLVVPSHAVREMARQLRVALPKGALVVNTAKGLEQETNLRLSEVLSQELPGVPVVVLSGPSHAEEVSRDMPTAVVAASPDRALGIMVKDLFMGPTFRVYTNRDMVGVELAGALKNVIALATGICDGLGLGDNSRAALMTRGLAEMARLGVRLGAIPLTFAGLAGIGDLIVTCNSEHSRNRRAGILLGRGLKLEEVLDRVGMVVEGVRTTRVACDMGDSLGVDIPIAREVYRILFEEQSPQLGVTNLMLRCRNHENEEFSSWLP